MAVESLQPRSKQCTQVDQSVKLLFCGNLIQNDNKLWEWKLVACVRLLTL